MEPSPSRIKDYLESLYKARVWIKLAGIISIVQGVMTILSLWGIIICWLPVWIGVILLKTARDIRTAYETENEEACASANAAIGKYFKLFVIFNLIFLGVALLGITVSVLIPVIARLA